MGSWEVIPCALYVHIQQPIKYQDRATWNPIQRATKAITASSTHIHAQRLQISFLEGVLITTPKGNLESGPRKYPLHFSQ